MPSAYLMVSLPAVGCDVRPGRAAGRWASGRRVMLPRFGGRCEGDALDHGASFLLISPFTHSRICIAQFGSFTFSSCAKSRPPPCSMADIAKLLVRLQHCSCGHDRWMPNWGQRMRKTSDGWSAICSGEQLLTRRIWHYLWIGITIVRDSNMAPNLQPIDVVCSWHC